LRGWQRVVSQIFRCVSVAKNAETPAGNAFPSKRRFYFGHLVGKTIELDAKTKLHDEKKDFILDAKTTNFDIKT